MLYKRISYLFSVVRGSWVRAASLTCPQVKFENNLLLWKNFFLQWCWTQEDPEWADSLVPKSLQASTLSLSLGLSHYLTFCTLPIPLTTYPSKSILSLPPTASTLPRPGCLRISAGLLHLPPTGLLPSSLSFQSLTWHNSMANFSNMKIFT